MGGREGYFFLGAISLGWVVVPYPKIAINLRWNYEKLPCIGSAVSKILRYTQIDRNPVTFIYGDIFLGPKLLEKLEPDNEKSDDIKLKEKHLEEGFTDLDKEK